jgi:hypothetical protein
MVSSPLKLDCGSYWAVERLPLQIGAFASARQISAYAGPHVETCRGTCRADLDFDHVDGNAA